MIYSQKGQTVVFALMVMIVFVILGTSIVYVVNNESKKVVKSKADILCFYIADSGISKAMWEIDRDISSYTGETDTFFGEGSFSVTITTTAVSNRYQVLSTGSISSVNGQMTIQAVIEKDPPAQVFNYAYFINNWGWYWGHDITSNGDIRSNGRFDFVDAPMVNGHIYAGLEIDDHGDGIRGTGGAADHQHEYADTVEMPNLQDISYYQDLAIAETGTVTVGGVTMIDAVYGDDAGETGNIVLVGTASNPIEINGHVVVTGDLVIKGKITGQGTIYSGRNIYIADTLEYSAPPSTPRPASEDPAVKLAWVQANVNKDLIALAATENIIVGDYTHDAHFGYSGTDRWYSNYWLFGMGSEDVGQDGIPDTGDTGEDDGVFTPEYEDLDGDGIFDDDYGWSDIETQTDITNFANLPAGVTDFSDIASNSAGKIEGILYTNHALACRVGYDMVFNGSVVSKDEAIIYRNNITLNYDERGHSIYRDDPNTLVDLDLPVLQGVRMLSWEQID